MAEENAGKELKRHRTATIAAIGEEIVRRSYDRFMKASLSWLY